MRVPWAAALLFLPAAGQPANLELEVAPGLLWSADSGYAATAPFLRARAGVEFPFLTLSLVGFDTLTGYPGPLSHLNQPGGLQAWGVAGEGRLHFERGVHQFAIGLGAGWGRLVALQAEQGDFQGRRGFAAPYVEGVVAYRASIGSIHLGLDFSLHALNRIYDEGDYVYVFCGSGNSVCPERQTILLYGLALTIGWQGKL